MRVLLIAALAMLGACAAGGASEETTGDGVFPVERGTAPRPPEAAPGQAAPPEGRAAGGLDFGQWRAADPAVYAPALQSQVTARYAGQTRAQIRADLEANGFACEDGQRLDCRIEIMERQCAFDWYVVVEPNRAEPIAGFDQMCLGAN